MDRYRQILEKAIQLSGVEQLEALKAFVEASKCISGVSEGQSYVGLCICIC